MKVLELKITPVDMSILVSGKEEGNMDRVNLSNQMGLFMKDLSLKTRKKVSVHKNTPMGVCTQVNGTVECGMVKENLCRKTGLVTLEIFIGTFSKHIFLKKIPKNRQAVVNRKKETFK